MTETALFEYALAATNLELFASELITVQIYDAFMQGIQLLKDDSSLKDKILAAVETIFQDPQLVRDFQNLIEVTVTHLVDSPDRLEIHRQLIIEYSDPSSPPTGREKHLALLRYLVAAFKAAGS